MVEPVFRIEFESATGQIMLDATYPAGHHHRTSMSRATLQALMQSAITAYQKSAA
jgi:hypothetical protein